MPRPDSAFAVIRRRESVLLVKSRFKRRWQLPGGSVEAGEAPWEAAVREVQEETGLDALLLGLSGIYRRRDGSLAFVFLARVPADASPAGPRHEIAKQKWIRIPKAVRRLGKGARRRLAEALRQSVGLRARRARIDGEGLLVVAG